MKNGIPKIYIGLMSGTSLDGVDAVAASFDDGKFKFIARESIPFPKKLRAELLELCKPGFNEIQKMQVAGNKISAVYAEVVHKLLAANNLQPSDIAAIGAHGQTIRHSPQLGVSTQVINAALLAELTGIDVICDFRNRDMAAGGQGAPLVPAFHDSIFRSSKSCAIVNIGGISNITILSTDAPVIGFDCGPGNMLIDLWIQKRKSRPYDEDGAWAQQGNINLDLLARFLAEPYFAQKPPKSTGRELFNEKWLTRKLIDDIPDEDIQRTALELTVLGIADAIERFAPQTQEIYVCGGGSRNVFLMQRLKELCAPRIVKSTDKLGVDPQDVEAAAFAWLAWMFKTGQEGNLPEVTGAKAKRVLGCLYPH